MCQTFIFGSTVITKDEFLTRLLQCDEKCSFLRIILLWSRLKRKIESSWPDKTRIFKLDQNSLTSIAFMSYGVCDCRVGTVPQCRSPKGERAELRAGIRWRLLRSRNRPQMFNSTSRYLVYCTINRGKESYNHTAICVTVAATGFTWAPPVVIAAVTAITARIVPRHNEPADFSPEFRALNRGPQCA